MNNPVVRFVLSILLLGIFMNFRPSPLRAQTGTAPADPKAVVTLDSARFTVLTNRLIRMEWSADRKFEEAPSLVVINRNLPVPKFTSRTTDGWQVINTDSLTLRYKIGSGKFTAENLSVTYRLNGTERTWKPGTKDSANLKGTIRTLDGVEGSVPLEPGLLSRDGWSLMDDSERPLFDNSDWPWVLPRRAADRQDWYFFGYGHDYKTQLFDFTRIAGKIPMPPRFAFGLWWSRYWSYLDTEFKGLVEEFEQHDVPLDVLVVDMDWHLTFNLRWANQPKDQAGQRLGWTGYTWDPNVFPDPEGFLNWCDQRGLKTTLNLHPASGVQPHELHYPEMARAMGIDPKTQKYVPFDIVDKKFATNYLDLMIRPLEKQGVDFWWLDWQQWGTTKIPGVTPTWWLNYVHFTDMERQGKARPLLFHRWGGLGNHRYQIGFSGDAISVWKTLAFEPYFTATASNVCYGYWSHDIGGHIPGDVSPELYTRWIQFGIFSPIIRTHTTKNPTSERRIWAYPPEYFSVMRDAILQRYALIPYIYTASREAYDTGISLCRPMYYDYPEHDEAYDSTGQYMFGDRMLVAPVATPIDSNSMLASKNIWLPEGEWFEWYTGARLQGPQVVKRTFDVGEIPLYVKTGSIIPMQPKMKNTGEKPVDPLILTVITKGAGADSGSTRVYEDAGNSTAYERNECAWTPVSYRRSKNGIVQVTIDPVEGSYPGMLKDRAYEIRIPGMLPPEGVEVNGRKVRYKKSGDDSTGWTYDGENLMTIVRTDRYQVNMPVTATITFGRQPERTPALVDGFAGKLTRLRKAMHLLNNQWPKEWSPDTLVHAVQTGNRIGVDPSSALSELEKLQNSFPEILKAIRKMEIDSLVSKQARNLIKAIQ